MAAQWTISHEERLVTVRVEGPVSLAEVEAYLDDLVVKEAMPYAKFIDARGAMPSLNDSDMMALGARISAYAVMDPRGPIAMVVNNGPAYEFAQRFANLGGARRAMEVFADGDKAWKWLKAQPLP